MQGLLHSGWLLGVISCLILVEAAALLIRYNVYGLGSAPGRYLANLFAGFSLMVCVQLAIWDAPTTALLACLSIAGLCHAAEFRNYWRGSD